jgi:hypothetical protein
VLLLVGIICVGRSSFKSEFRFNFPSVLVHVVNVQVFVGVIPADNVELVVVAEHIIRETAYLWKLRVPFHQILLHVELEAFRSAHSLVETAEDQYCFGVNRHTHSQITSSPSAFRV